MEWTTTSAILDGLKDFEDVRTWSLFCARFRPAIVGFARRRGLDDPAAEDAAQACLLAFAESYRAGRYDRGKGSLTRWLFTIARRRVTDALRELGRQRVFATAGGEGVLEVCDPESVRRDWNDGFEAAVLRQCLHQVRREVRPRTFRAFRLAVLEERPTAEVASELEMSRNAVFIAKYRVLARLKQLRRELDETL